MRYCNAAVPVFPKQHFTWYEPKAFRLLQARKEQFALCWWHRPAGVVFLSGLVMLGWWAAQFDPAKNPPPFIVALVGSVALGAFSVYFSAWFTAMIPCQVIVFESKIHLMRSRKQVIRFSDLTRFSFEDHDHFFTLVLTPHTGRPIYVGVPLSLPRDALTHFLSERIPRSPTDASKIDHSL